MSSSELQDVMNALGHQISEVEAIELVGILDKVSEAGAVTALNQLVILGLYVCVCDPFVCVCFVPMQL